MTNHFLTIANLNCIVIWPQVLQKTNVRFGTQCKYLTQLRQSCMSQILSSISFFGTLSPDQPEERKQKVKLNKSCWYDKTRLPNRFEKFGLNKACSSYGSKTIFTIIVTITVTYGLD